MFVIPEVQRGSALASQESLLSPNWMYGLIPNKVFCLTDSSPINLKPVSKSRRTFGAGEP